MWHREDRALASTTSTKSLPSLRSRRGADPAIRAQPGHLQPESPDRGPRGSNATDSCATAGTYSPLSTDGLSNPALGGIRSRRLLRREEQKVKAAEETMRAGQSRDKPTAPAATASTSAATTNYSPSSFSSHRKSSLSQPQSSYSPQVPLRKRALTSVYSSTIETPPVPDPSDSSYSRLYDRPRRSAPNLNLSLSSVPTPSRSSPLSPISTVNKKNRASANSDPVSSPLSPNAPKRSELSRHIAHQAVRPDVKTTMPSTMSYVENSPRAMNGLDKGHEEESATPNSTGARSRNEDIFLNLARSDSSRRESLGRAELRRSRYRFSNSSLGSPTSQVNQQTPSPDQPRFNNYDSPLHSNNISPSAPYSSIVPSSASAHPLDDHNRPRHSAVRSSSRSTVGLPQSRFSRTSPETSPRSPAVNPDRRSSLHDSRGYRYSTLSTIRSSRHPSGEETPERARVDQEKPRQGETESTLSTNAPSTVWDELDDLKSRIRKLELTGKLPPSSHEAMSSAAAERPRTAATTATTWSSSPKHVRKASIPSAESESSTTASQVHPLLQSALSRAKSVLSREVYNALEMTVRDALNLSSILGSGMAPSGSVTVVNGHGVSDKKARRKADSVCRNLTELCLALADQQLNTPLHTSHDGYPPVHQQNGVQGEYSTPSPTFQRGGSHEPEAIPRRRSTTRISSRLDGRRSSFVSAGVSNGQDPGHFGTKNTPSPNPDPPSRLSRLSTSSRTRKLQYDEPDSSAGPHSRSISRAMTDINPPPSAHRVLPRPRISHEYRPSYSAVRPPQNQSPASPSQPQQPQSPQPSTPALPQSGIPFRRSYMAPSNYTPATSRSSIQAGSRRYGFTPSPANASPADNTGMPQPQPQPPPSQPAQQPAQQSQTRIVAPSSKLATSYTPIPQNRMRTNSLDTRKFGYRQRPMSTVDGSAHTLDDSID